MRPVWIIDPHPRTLAVYTGVEEFSTLSENDTLTGGEVLAGFELPLLPVFAELDRTGAS